MTYNENIKPLPTGYIKHLIAVYDHVISAPACAQELDMAKQCKAALETELSTRQATIMAPERKVALASGTANRFGTPITIIKANYKDNLTWQVCAELAAKRAAQADGTCVVTILPDNWFKTSLVDKIMASDYNAPLFAPEFWKKVEAAQNNL